MWSYATEDTEFINYLLTIFLRTQQHSRYSYVDWEQSWRIGERYSLSHRMSDHSSMNEVISDSMLQLKSPDFMVTPGTTFTPTYFTNHVLTYCYSISSTLTRKVTIDKSPILMITKRSSHFTVSVTFLHLLFATTQHTRLETFWHRRRTKWKKIVSNIFIEIIQISCMV